MRPSAQASLGSRLARAAALLLALVSVTAALATPAAAARVRFGTQEYLQKIQDVDVKGPNGEALYLGYKYSHHSFIAPRSWRRSAAAAAPAPPATSTSRCPRARK
jgi:hypothetical protein